MDFRFFPEFSVMYGYVVAFDDDDDDDYDGGGGCLSSLPS